MGKTIALSDNEGHQWAIKKAILVSRSSPNLFQTAMAKSDPTLHVDSQVAGKIAAEHVRKIKTLKKSERKTYTPSLKNKMFKFVKLSPKTIMQEIVDCFQVFDMAFPSDQFLNEGLFGSQETAFQPFYS